MKTFVFAGPSIYGLGLQSSTGITILPPARCGDLLRVANEGAERIGLVDGVFGNEASVWHKEILVALSRGVQVFGAASMGALRAAECDRFGMVGVGRIYSEYRDGERTADSDVALLHGPAELEYRPLTVALVDVEATIEVLIERRLLSTAEAKRMKQAAATMHFTERTWKDVLAKSQLSRVLALIETYKVEQKKRDAVALVARLRKGTGPVKKKAARSRWSLNSTHFLAVLEGHAR